MSEPEVTMEVALWEAILALPSIEDPTTLMATWATENERKTFVELLADGFPVALLENLHAACRSNTNQIRRQNKQTLRDVAASARELPTVAVKPKRRLLV